ncbi:MAG: adenylyltransferase/cytidyltransferase family protein [Nanoarchaeota archaeon]
MGEYVPYQRLEEILSSEKISGKRIVLTGGCFELIHPGHLFLFEIAKGFGDILVVNVVNDERVRYHKGQKRPVIGELERAHVVSSIEWVDYSTIHPDTKKGPTTELALLIKPDVIIRGERSWGYREKTRLRKLLGYDVKLINIGRSNEKTSTTSIIDEIKRKYRIK